MTPSLRQIDHWMSSQHRLGRHRPTPVIPAVERIDAVEFVAKALQRFATATKVDLSRTIATTTDDRNSIRPAEVLEALTKLHAEVLAAYHTYGLTACLEAGVYELTNRSVPPGAGPKQHDPNFTKLMKDVYSSLPEDHVFD
jgi:hypothetical protein